MQYLRLDGCGAVTEAPINLLARNCPTLGELWITGLGPMGQLTINVTEAWARALPQACPRLAVYNVGKYGNPWGDVFQVDGDIIAADDTDSSLDDSNEDSENMDDMDEFDDYYEEEEGSVDEDERGYWSDTFGAILSQVQ
jgi:hypothetical protein